MNKLEDIQPLTLDGPQAAKLLGVSRKTLTGLTKRGLVPSIRIGSFPRYSREVLERIAREGIQQPIEA